jgi:hypothetical protein
VRNLMGRRRRSAPATGDDERDSPEREQPFHRKSLFDSMSNHMAKSVN